jgi:Zn-dependent metalloprotease
VILGDGDGELFNRFSIAADIIAKEISNGILQVDTSLVNYQQSGALLNSIAMVYASLVKQYGRKQTADKADWLIGDKIFGPKVKGKALFSLAEPGTAYDDAMLGKDRQPNHMRGYVRTNEDSGGTHINAGIPNRAFYLVATALGGYAWEKSGRIWYEAARDKNLKDKAQFRDFARLTYANAQRLYGDNSAEAKAVKQGWEKVGVKFAGK